MKMRIFLKKLQMFDEHQQPVYYIGLNPNSLQIVPGVLPDNEWKEFTDDCENLEKLNLTWRLKPEGAEGKSTSNIEQGSSDQIAFYNQAYLYIKEWMNESVSAPLNGIEVKIQVDTGIFSGFVIKNDGLTYCDTDTCVIEVMLKQKDEQYSCIQTTLIADNHSGMFDGNYQHPRIAYCNEFRPTWLLTVLWSIAAMQALLNVITYTSIYPILMIVYAIVKFLRKLGFKMSMDEPIKPHELKDQYIETMFQGSGCGREHPAPLVRDYISNVCSKCGVNVGATSIPLFYDPSSEYYNLTMLSAEVKKGVKHTNDWPWWIDDNRPLTTLDMFLNDLKKVFNAKWYVKNNTLFFSRKDFDEVPGYLYDFTGADKKLIIDGVCYTWNEKKKKAYANLGYAADAYDNLSTDAKTRFNDIVEYNNPRNPLLEGEDNKIVQSFAAARFRNDGIYPDYISEALKYVWIISVITGGITNLILVPLRNRLNDWKGALITQNDTLILPKLLIWDGQSKRNARVKYYHTFGSNMPAPNSIYNPSGRSYHDVHNEDVEYDNYYDEYNRLYNWPMAFDANFTGNLYDRFHQIDDPRVNPPMNKQFELKIALCLPDIERLGVLDQSTNLAVGRKIKLDGGQYYKEGRIEEIELSFDSSDKLGRWIKIKGTL
ncbi:hypothetical protein [Chryseobacterium viscerum]|uniref:Uncharacterized protein n=1 Tax=Chryseobacterium viscerum TaxID=1037377 RepID=A0A5N4BJ37_9FLAO|nr:hypothetical protein [Chryseobacterium viscerum]KAB1228457.1 hypothetical protein F8D52_22540 [Chryseobacterium viscerum]